MSNKVINNSPLKKLVKFYFSKYPTIDFSKITKMTNNFVKEINNYQWFEKEELTNLNPILNNILSNNQSI